jgi:hypothetical protein
MLRLADVLAELGGLLLDISHSIEVMAAGGRFDDPEAAESD